VKTTILFLCLLACENMAAQCSAKGPSKGSSFSENNSTGSYTWYYPSEARESDDVYTISKLNVNAFSEGSTHYLVATGFDFAIPSGAAICGIEVRLEKHYQVNSGILSTISDKSVRLLRNGNPAGSDRAAGETWQTTDALTSYGNVWDPWGTSWTAADINSPSFGVAISVTAASGAADLILEARIDQVTIIIHYNAILPVDFKDVRGVREQDHVLLSWVTASESNSSHFIVEKNVNDKWIFIDSVQAAVNSVEDKSYRSIDRSPLSTNIYRIRQVDRDGRSIYSRSVRVHFSAGANIIIRNYPNPAQKTLTVESSAPIQWVQLTDASGKIALHKDMDQPVYVTILNIAQLSAGVYMLQTDRSAKEAAKRIVIYR
jgi:hypothetical protein